MKKKIVGHLDKINPILHICNHLFGERHTHVHRISIGVAVIFFGVYVSKLCAWNPLLHFLCDAVGYLIHGAGAVPVLDYAICVTRQEKQTVVDNND